MKREPWGAIYESWGGNPAVDGIAQSDAKLREHMALGSSRLAEAVQRYLADRRP
jgi:hypothetical protein